VISGFYLKIIFEKYQRSRYNNKAVMEYKKMIDQYTVIVRKSKLEYVALCLDLNISARGVDLADVEKNLLSAIELYLQDINDYPETVVSPIPTEELIEFLQDTEPEWHKRTKTSKNYFLRPFEVHEVPAYV
jgi:predicted RNase H-like HicB family nuclease